MNGEAIRPGDQLIERARRRRLYLDEPGIPIDGAKLWTWATQAEVDDLLSERTLFSGVRFQLVQPEGQDLKVYGLRVEIIDEGGRRS